MRIDCRRQRGITLFVGLIFLVLLTIIGLAAFNAGRTGLAVVSNLQQRDQAGTAAQEAIEEAISTTRMYASPNSVLVNPCNGVNNTRCVDVNGDGVNDITVTLTPPPTCIAAKPAALSLPQDLGCVKGVDEDGNILSGCTDTLFVVRAQANDALTQSSLAVSQGVAVRILTTQASSICP
jgi:hypothetical protein